MKRKSTNLIGTTALICAVTGWIMPATAQLSIPCHTIDGGGGTSAGGSFSVSGTIGQPDALTLPAMTGGSFELTGGFWVATQVCYCPGDMNGDGMKDGADIQKFVNCMTSGGSCSCADVDAMNGITIDDAAVFINDLLSGGTCP